MKILGVIFVFGLLVLFAAGLTLWRRAAAWDGIPFPRRFVLAVGESWKWWLAYSVALLFFEITWFGSVPGGILAVVIAIIMALVFAFLRSADSRRFRSAEKRDESHMD